MAEQAPLAVAGVSRRPVCGVRDHATLLAAALERDGERIDLHWLSSAEGSLGTVRRDFRTWTAELERELPRERPRAVLLHYSVFSYAYRGIPLFVHPTAAALRRAQAPVIAIMHELVFPWRNGGLRGELWAATQRAALVELVRASAAIVVTAEFRARWLATRRWLPRRPVEVAPVFSNLPAPTVAGPVSGGAPVLGVFGYTLDGDTVALVVEAVRRVRERGIPLELRLLGAPGAESDVARGWERVAQERALGGALSFSGRMPAQELSDELASADVLLYADRTGPVSRKGTLAGALASGRPLLALEGRRRWEQLERAGAVAIARRDAEALAGSLAQLLSDAGAREDLGARGRSFAEQEMGVERTVAAVRALLAQVGAGRS
jgi:glycosyltransferase involved in cell wall biosynthesis